MRICLASIHPRRLSGQVESLLGLARQLEALGDHVVLASAFEDGELDDMADEGASSILAKLRRIWRAMRHVERAARGTELVHLNLPTPAFAALADVVRVRTGLPVVVGFEAHLADPAQLVRGGYLAHNAAFYLPRLLINNGLVARCALYACDRYVVSSHLQREELLALGVPETRVRVLPNVSNTGKLHQGTRREARQRLGLPDGPLISYIGHFHHVKGADVLASAFAAVRRAHPDAHLAIAWSGLGERRPVEQPLAEAGAHGRVTWLGVVDVGSLLAASDVLALPYRLTIGQNAYPNVLLEALSVGVPLVTSGLPLLEELLQDGETALLCPPGDPAGLATSINRLLADPDLGEQMRGRQRRLAEELLEPAVLGRRYRDLYLEVRHARAPAPQPLIGPARLVRPGPGETRVLQPGSHRAQLRRAPLRRR